MTTLTYNGWSIDVQAVFASTKRKHIETRVYIYTVGPRGGKRPIQVPGNAAALDRFSMKLVTVANLVATEEARQLGKARFNEVID